MIPKLKHAFDDDFAAFMKWGFEQPYYDQRILIRIEKLLIQYQKLHPNTVMTMVLLDLDEYSDDRQEYIVRMCQEFLHVLFSHFKCQKASEKKLLSDEETFLKVWMLIQDLSQGWENTFASVFDKPFLQYAKEFQEQLKKEQGESHAK